MNSGQKQGTWFPSWEQEDFSGRYNSKSFQSKMDSYYANQATPLTHFSGPYRQGGSGFRALAAGNGHVALTLARQFILQTAKCIGK